MSLWTLRNIEDRTFIPPRGIRINLPAGVWVKLFFDAEERTENAYRATSAPLWVKVLRRDVPTRDSAAVRYQGRLDSDPKGFPGLERDQLLEFGPEHIADWRPEP